MRRPPLTIDATAAERYGEDAYERHRGMGRWRQTASIWVNWRSLWPEKLKSLIERYHE
jgi:hypothetical protein